MSSRTQGMSPQDPQKVADHARQNVPMPGMPSGTRRAVHPPRQRQVRTQDAVRRRGDRTQAASQGRPADPRAEAELAAVLATLPRVSREEIEAARSKNGGWTKKQLARWGVPWPPPPGWRRALLRDEDTSDADPARTTS